MVQDKGFASGPGEKKNPEQPVEVDEEKRETGPRVRS